MEIDFNKNGGLVPAIIQDADTRNVLMLGYMNQEALDQTLSTKRVTFFSRSKQRLWTKGETSGNFLSLVHLAVDCDQDTLLVRVRPEGPVCHKGTDTCWGDSNTPDPLGFLGSLEALIRDRKARMPEGSYTTHLFRKGLDKIAQKVGEEAVEVVIEAKNDNKDLFLGEAADLTYHLMVLLVQKGYSLSEVTEVLIARHGKK